MNIEKVISREYKVMLQPEVFAGGEQQLLDAASTFWHEFKRATDEAVGDKDGNLDRIADGRTIKFYDTKGHLLGNNSYIFRERQNIGTEKREVTLKFRHVDRYISQDRQMKAGDSDRGRTKFEEDIKPPFVTLYSFSTTQKIADGKKLNKMKDVELLYPGVRDSLDHYEEGEEIEIIRGFTARELAIAGAKFQISKKPRLNSECALIVWYDNEGDERKPVVVEFSFRYGNRDGEYKRDTAYRGYEVFQILQGGLTRWIDANSKTKTAFVSNSRSNSGRDLTNEAYAYGMGATRPHNPAARGEPLGATAPWQNRSRTKKINRP